MAAKKKKKAAKPAAKKPAAKAKATKKAAKKATKKVAAKATAKKATAKKATAKKATAKKATAKKATAKATKKKATGRASSPAPTGASASAAPKRVVGPAKTNFPRATKARTKGQVVGAISESTGLSKAEVKNIFDTLNDLVGQDLKTGPGAFTLPGLLKMVVRRKPATKARKGVNPFTGEEMLFKAKPAQNVVRARPLKNLKEMV